MINPSMLQQTAQGLSQMTSTSVMSIIKEGHKGTQILLIRDDNEIRHKLYFVFIRTFLPQYVMMENFGVSYLLWFIIELWKQLT